MAAENTSIDKATYVVLDLETTGLSYRTDRITEIGAVKMVGGTQVATFEQLVNPQRVIPPKIIKLTGITNNMVYRASAIADILPDFAEFVGDAVLVAHNAPFDLSFLNAAARSCGHKSFRNRVLDTKLIAQKLKPMLGFYRLSSLANHFNVTQSPCHRALPDALATAEIFSHLLQAMQAEGLTTVGKSLRFFYPQERYDFSHKKHLAQSLPRTSGVYLMRGTFGEVIYVGKAKDLNKRVRSYFYSGPKTSKQLSLISDIKAIDHIKTGTEIGALLLESKLIKKFKPAYNVKGKQYRRYPFVHIDYAEEFPTPKIVRKVTDRGFHYGPFSNAADLELLLEVTKDLYRLKQCDYRINPAKKQDPCFYYQVNRCSGPCSGAITPETYQARLSAVMNAFDGRPDALRAELIRRRNYASDKLYFERAALFNRALISLERTSKILEGIRNAQANLNFVLVEELAGTHRLYLVTDGHLKSCVDVKNNKQGTHRLLQKITKTYFAKDSASRQITSEHIENLSLLTSYFHKRPVVRVTISATPEETLQSVMALIGRAEASPASMSSISATQLSPCPETDGCLEFEPLVRFEAEASLR